MSDEQRDYETREGLRIVTIAGLCVIIACVVMGLWQAPQKPVYQLLNLGPVPTLMPTATPQLAVPTTAVAEPQLSYSDSSITIVNNQTVIYQDDHSYTCVSLVCP